MFKLTFVQNLKKFNLINYLHAHKKFKHFVELHFTTIYTKKILKYLTFMCILIL